MMGMRRLALLTVLSACLLLAVPSAHSFVSSIVKVTKVSDALGADTIASLARLSLKPKGTSQVGKYLGALNLSEKALEDAYLRILIIHRKLSREEAEEMYRLLTRTPGFRTTLRKISGASAPVTKGHLNELRIASNATRRRMRVVAIGQPFDDGLKAHLTDIDILIHRRNLFAIEAKDFGVESFVNRNLLTTIRSDMDSLTKYVEQNPGTIPVFTMTNRPPPTIVKSVQADADRRKIQLIFGSPDEVTTQIKQLDDIL